MRWIVPLLIALALNQALHAESADRLSYVLMTGSDGSTMISGDTDDWKRAEAYRTGNAPLLYVRQNGTGYVIRDAAILRRAEAIMEPQQELGRRQGELGRVQGQIGRAQGALGAEQGRLGRLMANASARGMGELGRRQAALGRRQGALGREQARLAELAQPKFRALVAEAIGRGLAQRVD